MFLATATGAKIANATENVSRDDSVSTPIACPENGIAAPRAAFELGLQLSTFR